MDRKVPLTGPALVLDLMDRTKDALLDILRLSNDTQITFKLKDVVNRVEENLPQGYPEPPEARRRVISAMAMDLYDGFKNHDCAETGCEGPRHAGRAPGEE